MLYAVESAGIVPSLRSCMDARPDVTLTILAVGDKRGRRVEVTRAGPMTLVVMWERRAAEVRDREFCEPECRMAAMLMRTSILMERPEMDWIWEGRVAMEDSEEVSHSRMWILAEEVDCTVCRAVMSAVRLRTRAKMVLEGLCDRWRTFSRPRPVRAPEMTKVGMLVAYGCKLGVCLAAQRMFKLRFAMLLDGIAA